MKSLRNFENTMPNFSSYLKEEGIEIVQLVETEDCFIMLLSNSGIFHLGSIDKSAIDDSTLIANLMIIDHILKGQFISFEFSSLEEYSNFLFFDRINDFTYLSTM